MVVRLSENLTSPLIVASVTSDHKELTVILFKALTAVTINNPSKSGFATPPSACAITTLSPTLNE